MTENSDDEWFDWVEHDGGPVLAGVSLNMTVEMVVQWCLGTKQYITRVGADFLAHDWTWAEGCECGCKKYRIKKPRALSDLLKLSEGLPDQVADKELEDA